MRRKGRTFWEILSKHKIPCHIFFCPNTFPAEKIYGEMLSGMGTPDLYGTMGRFCFYTNKDVNEEKKKDSRGKIISVMPDNYIIETAIYGPKIDSKGTTKEISIPLKIILKPNKNEIEIKLQQKLLILKRGAWSNWQRIYFDIGPFKKIYGIVKFYLKSIEPGFELYLSPINFDPQNPIFPISYPPDYSQKLSKRIGLYYTQGMPNDTWALNEGWFDERIFLQQLDLVLEEKKKILTEELKHFKKGVFFMYIDSLDIVQHMFWRYIDPEYPHFVQDSTYNDTIYKYYEKIDSILGEILKSLKKDTTLIALSDHGFNSFRRAVHLNRWLLENGFLYLKEGRGKSDEFFEDVNWAKTKAYALGFGGIYINMKNRESEGIVSAGEENLIKREISDKLKLWIDPVTHEKVLKDIYTKEDIFKGIYMADAPDLFVGFNPGFRTSWQTALGGVPEIIIEDNTKKWSGDHLFDPSFVPGVIFMNKRIKLDSPSITDIASTILKLFDIPEYKETNGKNIF
jgi:predicted AlkP superfamily phosphohydrolase/phosphomutase